MTKIKWGLVGCGDISRKRVAPAINELDICELVAVSRADVTKVESFANEFGAKRWYAEWPDLLNDDEIDAVYISTPVFLHAQQVIAAADAGKHILCEKPMAMNTNECDLMIESCEKNNVKLGIAYYRHFYPVVNKIKEILSSGEIGKPVIAEANAFEWFERKPGEPRYWLLEKEKSGGGPMMDFGCHRIEVMQNLFGKVKELQSQLMNLHFNREVEDTAFVSLNFENGVNGIIKVSHAAFESRDSLDIFGTNGSIHIPVLNGEIMTVRTANGERTEKYAPHRNVHLPSIKDFAESVINKTNPVVDGKTGKSVTEVLDKIYKNN